MKKEYKELLITLNPILESLEFLEWLDNVNIPYKINNEDKVVISYLDLIYQRTLTLEIFKSYVNKVSQRFIFAGDTKNILNYFGINEDTFIRDEKTGDYYISCYGLLDIYKDYEIVENNIDIYADNLLWRSNVVYVKISSIDNNERWTFSRCKRNSREIIKGLKAGVFCDNPILEGRLFNVI